MKAAQKKKLAEMLLPLLIKQGLKTSGLPYPAPVLVNDIKEAEDILDRMGYEFITGRRFQANPRDTSKKIHIKMINDSPRIGKPLEETSVIWICLDAEVALKALVLGGFPETIVP